jgi:hypothetical protein
MAFQIATAGSGVLRDNHWVLPTGASERIRTLLLEPQRTNLAIRSQELDTWTDTSGSTVTANAAVAPDGTTTADLLTATASGSGRRRSVTFTGDGTKAVSLFLKQGTAAENTILLRDLTASVNRIAVRTLWSAGALTLSIVGGGGIAHPPQPLGNGWWRVLLSADGVVAANSHVIQITVDPTAGTGTVLAWGAQAENAVVPSSYIPTEGTTVTRNADSLYWEVPSLNPPREMTLYVRGVELLGTALSNERYIQIGDSANADARLLIYRSGATTAAIWDPATQVAVVGAAKSTGDLLEMRLTLSAAGVIQLGTSINGGAESLSAAGAAQALPAAFSAAQIWLNSVGAAQVGLFGFTHVAVALGQKSRAEMRAIAGIPA